MKKLFLVSILLLSYVIGSSQTIDSTVKSCNLDKSIDDFTNEVTYTIRDAGGDISYIKTIKNGVIKYYLSIWIKESDIYTGTGVILILENGKKINKPNAEVESDYTTDSFFSKTFISLNANDIILLQESGIMKYKLYISEGVTSFSKETQELFKCLVKAK